MSDPMGEIMTLLGSDIPEGRQSLLDSHSNLERVAEYCEGNYFQSQNKTQALQETKSYTIQSLASVAYQINTLACNFLHLLDRQAAQLADMESSVNHIAQTVAIYKEKVARREIGILTTNKGATRQFKIVAPAQTERPIKYVRKPIDFTALDDIGHGVRQIQIQAEMAPRPKRGSSQGSLGTGVLAGPAPSQKPPTPPQAARTGTLLRNKEYRVPTTVAPPQVPSHYAPNYPVGHPRHSEVRISNYNTLPPPSQVGMVHPMQAADRQTMPPPPPATPDYNAYPPGHVSPPLPPPPPEQCHTQSLPEGVPSNYIEKVVAIYDYAADKDDELSFQENAVIYVLKKNDDGWWEGVLNSVTGLFPGNYVEPLH